MSKTSVKLRWANKLIKSNTFVVITDKSSAMYIPDAKNITDEIRIVSQLASLRSFREALDGVIKDFEKKVGGKSAKKIKVKKTGRKQSVKVKR